MKQTSMRSHPTLVLIVDRRFHPPSSSWRKRCADRTRVLAFFVFVSESEIARDIHTALNWLHPPRYKHGSFESFEQAMRWVESVRGPSQELRALYDRARLAMNDRARLAMNERRVGSTNAAQSRSLQWL